MDGEGNGRALLALGVEALEEEARFEVLHARESDLSVLLHHLAATSVLALLHLFLPEPLEWCQDNGNRSNQESKFDFLATCEN